MNYKMQRQLHFGKDATFNFGIRDSKEMEEWNTGIQFLDDWSYFDSDEKKLGWLKMFGKIEFFRKTQWTVHYTTCSYISPSYGHTKYTNNFMQVLST